MHCVTHIFPSPIYKLSGSNFTSSCINIFQISHQNFSTLNHMSNHFIEEQGNRAKIIKNKDKGRTTFSRNTIPNSLTVGINKIQLQFLQFMPSCLVCRLPYHNFYTAENGFLHNVLNLFSFLVLETAFCQINLSNKCQNAMLKMKTLIYIGRNSSYGKVKQRRERGSTPFSPHFPVWVNKS